MTLRVGRLILTPLGFIHPNTSPCITAGFCWLCNPMEFMPYWSLPSTAALCWLYSQLLYNQLLESSWVVEVLLICIQVGFQKPLGLRIKHRSYSYIFNHHELDHMSWDYWWSILLCWRGYFQSENVTLQSWKRKKRDFKSQLSFIKGGCKIYTIIVFVSPSMDALHQFWSWQGTFHFRNFIN